jgi:hypothetical protein
LSTHTRTCEHCTLMGMGTVTPTGVCRSLWFLWFTTGFHSLLLFWYIIKYIKYRLIIFTLIHSPSAHICSKRGGNSVPPLAFAARGGWVVPSRHPHPHCTPFHPMSSCSWWWLGVLLWWWSSGVVCHCLSLSSLLSLSLLCRCHSTYYPPHEQLLMRLGAGGVPS